MDSSHGENNGTVIGMHGWAMLALTVQLLFITLGLSRRGSTYYLGANESMAA